jgi:hypothetical protein
VLAAQGFTLVGWTTGFGHGAPNLSQPPTGSRVTAVFVDNMSPTDATQVLPGRDHDVVLQVISPSDPTYRTRLREGFAPSQSLKTC